MQRCWKLASCMCDQVDRMLLQCSCSLGLAEISCKLWQTLHASASAAHGHLAIRSLWLAVRCMCCAVPDATLPLNLSYLSPRHGHVPSSRMRVHCMQTFCRKFLWHSLMLWPEDLPARTVIAASCNDDLVPAEMVSRQLREAKSSAIMMLHPTACHGGFLVDTEFQGQLIQHIQSIIKAPS